MSSVSVCESRVGLGGEGWGRVRGRLYRSFKSWLFLLFLRSTLKIRGARAPLSASSRAFKASKTSASRSTDRTGAPPGCAPSLVLIPLIPPPPPTSVSRPGESTGSPTGGAGWGLGSLRRQRPASPPFCFVRLLLFLAPYQQSIGCTNQFQSP